MRNIPLITGQYYHIYNRGVNKEQIFFQPQNWYFFLRRVRQYFTIEHADVIAFCLMPNHYHLLVYNKSKDFGRLVMHPMTVSYTKAINKQQGRSGHLFQGSFQAQLIDKNEYLLYLSRYIHLNPVVAGLAKSPQDWEFSSYRDYISKRTRDFLKPELILEQFASLDAYEDFVCNSVELDKKISVNIWMDS